MKKIIVFLLIIVCFIAYTPTVKAESWVETAINQAKSFFKEPVTVPEELGFVPKLFKQFKKAIKTINMVLLILLAGISIIAFAIVGIRYIAGGASPEQHRIARISIKKIFIGMIYGFGAFFIWNITISIIQAILNSV